MRQLIALSGNGFSVENPSYIDEYITKQFQEKRLKICFIPTASQDALGYIEAFHAAFDEHETTHVIMSDLADARLKHHIYAQHILYVGGGDTQFMLDVWRQTGFDRMLREAYLKGVLLVGLSAGAIAWFTEGITFEDGDYRKIQALDFVPGTYWPHYNDEHYDGILEEPVYKMPDDVALHFRNERLIAKIETPFNELKEVSNEHRTHYEST